MSIVILDTECTGLPNQAWARVVEIGAVVLHPHRDYAEINSFQSFVFPEPFDDRADRALAYNGIPREAVLGARGDADVRRAFYLWMAQHQATEVFSYNRAFDENLLRRSGFDLPWTGCVLRMARDAMPKRAKDPSLVEAVKHFGGEPSEEAHRALPDARMAASVFAAIRRRS